MKQFAFILAVGLALHAQVTPDPADPIRSRSMARPDYFIKNLYLNPNELDGNRAQELIAELESAGLNSSLAQMDVRSGRFGGAIPPVPLLPGTGYGNQLSWSDFGFQKRPASSEEQGQLAWNGLLEFLQTREAALHIDIHELIDGATITVHNDGDFIQIHAQRHHQGLVVRNAYVHAVINHGNLILFGIHGWGDIDLQVQPTLQENEAIGNLQDHLTGLGMRGLLQPAQLVLVPLARQIEPAEIAFGEGLTYRLAWSMQPRFDGFAEYEGLVDAHTGELIAFQETTQYLAGGGATGYPKVVGGQYPVSNDGVAPDGIEVKSPMPFLNVTVGSSTYTTSSAGELPCFQGTMSTALVGPFIAITDDCGAVNQSSASGVLDLGFGPTPSATDCTVAPGASAGNTKSARSAYYEINRIKEMARSHLPNNGWLPQQLPVNVNINQTCNATGGPSQLRFYKSGGGCFNTGELAGVFDHEWGHGMDGADATPGISSPGEGIADIYAAIRLNTSCIGRHFRSSNCGGYGDPCLNCSGVRDIDYAKRSSGNPHTITFLQSNCGSGPAPCGGSVHCEGSVYSESVWDLWKRDLPTLFGMSDKTAQELVTRLTFIGSGGVTTWFQCVQGSGGCPSASGYMNYLAADDNNGNLLDGTPHMTAIHSAFNRHGIACSTPAIQNSTCASLPTTAPTLAGSGVAGGSSLSWNSIPNALSYRVFRTEGVFGCGFGSILVDEVAGTTFSESGLLPGREYYYSVQPMGSSDTCMGPVSNCLTVIPAINQTLGLTPQLTMTMLDGDGDPFLDNCETAEFDLELFTLGALSNIQITGISLQGYPESSVVTTLPISLGSSSGDCDLLNTSISVIPEGMAYGDTLTIELTLTSTQTGAFTKTFTVSHVETDLSAPTSASYTFDSDTQGWTTIQGTFARTSTGGGASGSTHYMASSASLDNQCDQVRSPLFMATATTTLELFTSYAIEDQSSGSWWDRANVGVYRLDNATRTVISPSSGRSYNASGGNGPCVLNNQLGWAGSATSWSTSTWNASAFQSSTFNNELVQLDIFYGTDGAEVGTGFHFDQVSLQNVRVMVADGQTSSCNSCAQLDLEDWPVQNVLTFIDCQNQPAPPLVAKRPSGHSTSSRP